MSTTEEIARDDIRREAAAFWVASINSDGQAYESDPTDTIGK